MSSKERIKLALTRTGATQSDLAKKLQRDPGTVSEQLNKPGEMDSVRYLEATAELTGYNFEWLRTGNGPETTAEYEEKLLANRVVKSTSGVSFRQVNEEITEYLSGKIIRPVTVTVAPSGKDLITYVPVKAQAGYKRGFGDPQYIETLPAFNLPVNIAGAGTFRMFQVDGNSMLQLGGGGLHDGDIVIASYVEDIFTMKDNRVYVVVSTEGILVKRCINRLKVQENRVVICNSDNKNGEYPPIILHPHEILEVWELKAFISRQLSFNTDLWETLNDIQVQQALMQDRIKDLEGSQQKTLK